MGVSLTNINIGSAPGDGTGDPARTAFDKINDNNDALEAAVLDQSEVDARVVAVASGAQRDFLRCGDDLRSSATLNVNTVIDGSLRRLDTYTLGPSADTLLYWVTAMPKRWNAGTLRFRFYWQPSNTNTGVCRFRAIPLPSTADSAAFSTSAGTAQVADDAGAGTADVLQITDWTPAVTVSGAADDTLLGIVLQRQGTSGSDTFTGDAELIGVEVEWTADAVNDD